MSLRPGLAALAARHGDPHHECYRGRVLIAFTPGQFTAACKAVARAERERCAALFDSAPVGEDTADSRLIRALPDPDWATAP